MRLDRLIAKSRILEIKSSDYKEALSELLASCPLPKDPTTGQESILKALLDREQSLTTYLGNGIALPHLRLDGIRPRYLIAAGRCPKGLEYEGQPEYRDIRLIFLLLADTSEQSFLNVLRSLARVFQNADALKRMEAAPDLSTFREQVVVTFGRGSEIAESKQSRFNKLIQDQAGKLAKTAKCSAVLVFGDAFTKRVELRKTLKPFKTILVSKGSPDTAFDHKDFHETITVRAFSSARLAQLRSAVLIGLTREIFTPEDRLCCISGLAGSNQFDSVVIVDVAKEFHFVSTGKAHFLPNKVRAEVLERILAIATELAVEGREGRSVGCFFVLGGTKKIKKYIKPLILNPFFGYKEEDRNILNPFMDETVKELSSLDGAFIIQGNGTLEVAGALIHVPDYNHELPSGLGSRHAAAAAVSQAADCVAIVVSSSTGQVNLFRRGEMIPLLEKRRGDGI